MSHTSPAQGGEGRSRIVIQVSAQQSKAPRATGCRRWLTHALAAVGVLIVVAAISLYFVWRSYRTMPQYSLALLADAVARNDTDTVNELIDTRKIAESFIPQVTEKASQRYSPVQIPEIKKQIDALLPSLMPDLDKLVREEVNRQVKLASERAEGRPFLLIALGAYFLIDTTVTGDNATSIVTIRERKLELSLARNGDRWKVVGVKDDKLAGEIVDRVVKALPDLKKKTADEIRERIKKSLPIELPKLPF